jgi:hypothetical protein
VPGADLSILLEGLASTEVTTGHKYNFTCVTSVVVQIGLLNFHYIDTNEAITDINSLVTALNNLFPQAAIFIHDPLKPEGLSEVQSHSLDCYTTALHSPSAQREDSFFPAFYIIPKTTKGCYIQEYFAQGKFLKSPFLNFNKKINVHFDPLKAQDLIKTTFELIRVRQETEANMLASFDVTTDKIDPQPDFRY